jgi:fucose permease
MAAASGVDIKTVVAQLVAGGVGGAVTTIIVGMIKNLAAKS